MSLSSVLQYEGNAEHDSPFSTAHRGFSTCCYTIYLAACLMGWAERFDRAPAKSLNTIKLVVGFQHKKKKSYSTWEQKLKMQIPGENK